MTQQTNVVAIPQSKNGFLMEPQSIDEAWRFAEMLAASSLVPKMYQGKPNDVFVACQWGAELGMKPLQSLQGIAVINGLPSVWGDALVGLSRASGLCEYIQKDWDERTKTATCTVKRKGEPRAESQSFSEEDARLAGLLAKETYKKNLRRMLENRARAFVLRDVFADVLKGMKIAEEVDDYPEEKDITPPVTDTEKPLSKAESVLDKVRTQKKTTPPMTINAEPVIQQEDYSHEFSMQCDALDNTEDLAQWTEAYNNAWQWASNKPKNVQDDIKAHAGSAKKRLAEKDQIPSNT